MYNYILHIAHIFIKLILLVSIIHYTNLYISELLFPCERQGNESQILNNLPAVACW